MIKTFDIGKYIYAQLSTIEAVGTRVFPLIAENSTTYPFIIYHRDSVSPSYCKDGHYEDDVQVTIQIATSDYNSGLDIAQSVREKLTSRNTIYNNQINISSEMVSASEYWNDPACVQSLTFQIKINN